MRFTLVIARSEAPTQSRSNEARGFGMDRHGGESRLAMTVTEMPCVPVSVLERLLAEDVPNGDLTTLSLGIGDRSGAMEFRARQAMTVAGSDVAADMIEHAGAEASLLLAPARKPRRARSS
jgi:hypothetical protein